MIDTSWWRIDNRKSKRLLCFVCRWLVVNTTFFIIVSGGFVIGSTSATRGKLTFRRFFPAEGAEWGLGTGSRSFAFWRTGGSGGGSASGCTRRCWRPGRTTRWCGYTASADNGTQIANNKYESSYLSTAKTWLWAQTSTSYPTDITRSINSNSLISLIQLRQPKKYSNTNEE